MLDNVYSDKDNIFSSRHFSSIQLLSPDLASNKKTRIRLLIQKSKFTDIQ